MKHVPDAHGNCSRWCNHLNRIVGQPWTLTKPTTDTTEEQA